jgi:gliding motility-associated lipoprotein GldH
MKKYLIFLSVILVSACNNNSIYKMNAEIPNMEWARSNIIKFNTEIIDKAQKYDLTLLLRHSDAYLYSNFLFNMKIVYPSGKEVIKDYEVQVRDKNNEFTGDGAGDIWDLETPIEKEMLFDETGKIMIEIKQAMDCDPLNMVMEAGINIEKSKSK